MSAVLRAEGIVKTFDSLVANDHIDFELREGELHALLGENGSGKTTLLNVLYGLWKPDEGNIFIKEKKVKINSPLQAIMKYKIGKVSQHSDLVPTFTVSENITYRGTPTKYGFLVDRRAMRAKLTDLVKITSFKIDSDAVVENLSVGEQQHVELLKVLYQDAEIIFLDESSSLLAPQEVKELFILIKSLTQRGRAIVFVTHKLDEALQCDRITVLRNGRVSLAADRKDISKEDLLKAMFSGKIDICKRTSAAPHKELSPILEAKDICAGEKGKRSELKNVSLALYPGEILGIAGIAGNGQKELLDAITGSCPSTNRTILLRGKDFTRSSFLHMYRKMNVLAYIPEESRHVGALLNLHISENMILGEGCRPQFFPRSIRKHSSIASFAEGLVAEYDVHTTGIYAKASSLSGGNLQKMILARELSIDPDVIITAQPTRGLDFKTTEFVHRRLLEKREQGKAILLVSNDLEEVLKLSDRIAVMYEGKLINIPPDEVSVDKIGRIMVGMGENN